MKRRAFLQLGLGLGIGLGTGLGAVAALAAANLQWSSRTLNAMGTSMTLKVAHTDAAHAARALDAAIADIRQIENQMSLFRADSAICQLNRSGRLDHPPADLLAVLRMAQEVAERSDGAFDATVQPLWLAFEKARQQGRLPTRAEVQAARQLVGWRGLEVSPRAVRLRRTGMGITLNGIAQGFAADKVKARLHSMGIAHALIDAGEWASLGQPAHAGDWTLGVASPRASHTSLTAVAMQGRCVATSADDQCTFSPDFANHHILDPHTGYSPKDVSSVSVLAPSCALADALTKVMFIAGFEQSQVLAQVWAVDVVVVNKQGRWKASPGVSLRAV